MARVHPKTKQKAFRLRLEGSSIAEAARRCGISRRTVTKFERGWIDKNGTRHAGWRGELERLRAEQEKAELDCGLALKEERVKAYERLAKQAIELIEKDFPNIEMKSASDAKALISEVRELCRLISIELGEYRPKGGAPVGIKVDITPEELRERYEAAQAVEVEEIKPPREAHLVTLADAEDETEPESNGAET